MSPVLSIGHVLYHVPWQSSVGLNQVRKEPNVPAIVS